ncbi:MAG: hypothetical protein VYB24_07215, partial [Pseudomonadota bacterium]|nr:hypothetical protein [Pseudomonadota bacterium]
LRVLFYFSGDRSIQLVVIPVSLEGTFMALNQHIANTYARHNDRCWVRWSDGSATGDESGGNESWQQRDPEKWTNLA